KRSNSGGVPRFFGSELVRADGVVPGGVRPPPHGIDRVCAAGIRGPAGARVGWVGGGRGGQLGRGLARARGKLRREVDRSRSGAKRGWERDGGASLYSGSAAAAGAGKGLDPGGFLRSSQFFLVNGESRA